MIAIIMEHVARSKTVHTRYVKPLFRDMDAYDVRQDREKVSLCKLYEGLVGGISALLTRFERKVAQGKNNHKRSCCV